MIHGKTPRWLSFLERRLQWLAVPHIAILFVTLQALGWFMVLSNPRWRFELALIPEAVLQGQVYRLITFLALPISSGIWMLFVLWFIYFILNTIESVWGAFKTTFYVLTSLLVMIAYSFAFSYPILAVDHFESTLFLAAAALFPDTEILLFFFPVKMKWLAILTGAFILLELVRGGWEDRFFLVAVYSNYLIFFGPALIDRIRNRTRRARFKSKLR